METKFFDIPYADAQAVYQIMAIVSGRCAGEAVDPDSGEGWQKFENVDISVVRSTKRMPEALESHNQVSDLRWEFTVAELAADYSSPDCNEDVFEIGHEVGKLPIGRNSSHYYIKVELS